MQLTLRSAVQSLVALRHLDGDEAQSEINNSIKTENLTITEIKGKVAHLRKQTLLCFDILGW